MPVSKQLRKTIAEKSTSFCKHSTLHGFYYFYKNTHGCVHFTWALIILASVALCCFLSHMIWEKYDTDPTLTVVESTHYSVTEIPFPAVTLCDSHVVYRPNTGDITQLFLLRGYNMTQIKEFYRSFSDIKMKGYSPEPYVKKMHSLLYDLGYPYKLLLHMFKKPCDHLIEDCVWRSRSYNCSDMFRLVFTVVGYCCQFDISYFRDQVGPETNFMGGVQVTEGLEMSVTAHTRNDNTTDALLYVFDKKDVITLLDSAVALTPAAYFDVNIYVWAISSSTYVKQLPLRSRKCILETDAGVGVSFYQGCMSQLMLRRVVNLCRCLPFEYTAEELGVEDYSICTWDRLICIYQAIENIKVDIRHIISESECYQRCDYVEYATEIEFVKFQRHLAHVTGAHTKVAVHFSDNTCMKYRREVLYTWDQMLANLGGIFGLCLGGSIVSIIEVVWFVFDLLFSIVATLSKKQVEPKKPKKNELFLISQKTWLQKKPLGKQSGKFKFIH